MWTGGEGKEYVGNRVMMMYVDRRGRKGICGE